jgi:hypothetical protein
MGVEYLLHRFTVVPSFWERPAAMSTYMSKEVRDGLRAAQMAALKKSSRLRVLVGDEFHPVLRMWKDGFAVEEETAPVMRGLVDIYDGGQHIYQCLIVASEADAGEMCYEFKRNTTALDRAPLDFYRDPQAPAGLLSK